MTLEQIFAAVKTLPPDEQHRLKEMLNTWLGEPSSRVERSSIRATSQRPRIPERGAAAHHGFHALCPPSSH